MFKSTIVIATSCNLCFIVMSLSKRDEESVSWRGQCVPGTGGTERAGRDSDLSRQAVVETETTVVGREPTSGTDGEVDVVGVSRPDLHQFVSGLGEVRECLGGLESTVPSPAPVVLPAKSVVSGFPASAAPLSAHVDSEDSLRVYETSVVTLSSPAHVTTDDAFVGETAGEFDGSGSESEGLTLADLRRTGACSSEAPETSQLPPSKCFVLSLLLVFRFLFSLLVILYWPIRDIRFCSFKPCTLVSWNLHRGY